MRPPRRTILTLALTLALAAAGLSVGCRSTPEHAYLPAQRPGSLALDEHAGPTHARGLPWYADRNDYGLAVTAPNPPGYAYQYTRTIDSIDVVNGHVFDRYSQTTVRRREAIRR